MQNNADTTREASLGIKIKPVFRIALLTGTTVALLFSAFYLGRITTEVSPEAQAGLDVLNSQLAEQQQTFSELKASTQAQVNGMSARLASLQAGATRMNALGQRLVEQGKLDSEEFNFTHEAPVGGPESLALVSSSMGSLNLDIDKFSTQLQNQQLKFHSLESLLMGRELDRETTPKGWPVSKGWISSAYGTRTDPFTGKQARHSGVDFVGKRGADVLAVADGVIVWAAKRGGYGKSIDIDHGNGYLTRYAHNDELLVSVGSEVKAGSVIGKLGSTGRASAPHVHFEVHKDGRSVNPWKFLN
ncbi:MAG: M23 family metallopeptidase [Xanthomonadales bacterium]|nr:M23 family metallopeptidase [Xanthomonadales bacterium]